MDMWSHQNKKIASELQNIVYNIAQTDFESNQWPECIKSIEQRLQGDSNQVVVGLDALKELMRAFQYELEDGKRKVLVAIAEHFFQQLENIMTQIVGNANEPNQLRIMIGVAKIFFQCNTLRLLPFFIQPGRLNNWIEFVVAILDS